MSTSASLVLAAAAQLFRPSAQPFSFESHEVNACARPCAVAPKLRAKGIKAVAKLGTGAAFRSLTITVLAVSNPKLAGSKVAARFALYSTGQSVGAFLAAGGTCADVRRDAADGFISIE